MPDSNETNKPVEEISTLVNQTKEEIKKELEKATSEDEKKTLGKKIKEEIERISITAQEVVEDEKSVEEGRKITRQKTEEGKRVLRVFTRAVEAVRHGLPAEYISSTKEGAVILKKLAETKVDFTPSTSAAITYYLGDFIFGTKKIEVSEAIESDFEKNFIELFSFNKIAGRLILDKLIEAIERGEITSITKDHLSHIERKIRDKEKKLVKERSIRDYISLQEEDEWNKLFHDLNEKVNTKIDQLSDKEKESIYSFLWGGNIEDDPEKITSFNSACNKLGITQDEIKKYIDLRQKFTHLPLELIKNYAGVYKNNLERAERDFSISNITKLFIDEQGKINLSSKEARKRFRDLINKYYFDVLREIHANKTAQFHDAFRENNSYQYYFTGLSQIIFQSCEELERSLPEGVFKNEEEKKDFLMFLLDTKTRFQSSIMTYANIFHNLPLWARGGPGSFEKWAEFMGSLFHSELAEVFDDGGFMDMARRVVTTVIRREIAKNGNQYPSDLFSGEYKEEGARWSQKFERLIREELEKVAKSMGLDIEKEGWKIERALVYSPAIGIDTLIDIETMATADPKTDFKGIHPLLQVISAKFNWTLGRGETPGRIARFLLSLPVEYIPKKEGAQRLWRKKRWVPKEFADMIDRGIKNYGDEIINDLYSAGGLYQELLNMLTIAPSLISRHGWRMSGIYDELSKIPRIKEIRGDEKTTDFWRLDDKWSLANWQIIWDEGLRKYGTASLWWFIDTGPGRLNQELKRLVLKQKEESEVNSNFDLLWIPGNYQVKNKMLEEAFEFEINGKKRKMSLLEIRQMRLNQLRGELFFRYLRRDPGNFILLLSQMAPQLVEEKNPLLDDISGSTREEIIRSINSLPGKSKLEKQKILAEFDNLYSKWGDFFFKLKEVRSLIKEKSGGDIPRFIDELITQSNIALQETIKRKGLYCEENDFRDARIRDFIYGEKGVIKILTSLDLNKLDEFYQKFGDYDRFGEDNFFYRMANTWFIKEFNINPFSADINHFEVFKHIGKGGEDVFTRLHGDTLTIFQKCIKELSGLSELLLEVAQTGNMEKIYALHKNLYEALSGAMGQEYAQRANYILAQIVSKFFLEHSLARDPKLNWVFPLSLLTRFSLTRELSLSRILTNNIHAFTMDTNAVKSYFMMLAHRYNFIPQEGAWSKEQLERVFDATKEQFFVGDFVPKFLWFLILFLLFSYAKKAIEEAQGKKK
jgi:hypothetical protein